MVRCRRCSTLHTAVVPGAEILHGFYQAYDTAAGETSTVVKERLASVVASFEASRRTGRLLDVGFGAGALLDAARQAGWSVAGTEMSDAAVSAARARGFSVVHGSLADAAFAGGEFDVVALVEVLEHLVDPLAALVEVRRVLRPGGVLWATTPHGRGLSARVLGMRWSVICPLEHLQLFSVAGMRRLLERAGFRRASFAVHGTNPYELLAAFRRQVEVTERARTGQALNERLSASPSRRLLKTAANGVLSALRLGDSLKIRATA